MAVYRLTDAAEADIVEILAWSEEQFGSAARLRYERLIVTALVDIASDPIRPGSLARPELGTDVRSWHLRGSRDRAKGPDDRPTAKAFPDLPPEGTGDDRHWPRPA